MTVKFQPIEVGYNIFAAGDASISVDNLHGRRHALPVRQDGVPMARRVAFPTQDWLESSKAGMLAKQIEAHWRARGYMGIRVERYLVPGTLGTYAVRSNIGPDGYPPRQCN